MKKLTFLLACIICIFLFSCESPEDLSTSKKKIVETAESYVYRERDPNLMLILSVPRERLATRATELQFDDMLGRSFKLDYFPFENMQNVGEPVIDMARLEADHPAWATKFPLRQSVSSAFSYATFNRYEQNSSSTTTVNSGVKLNLGIFSIGNENTYYSHFTSSLITSSKSVFGQLDIEIKDAAYRLSINSSRFELIRKDYIEADFIDDRYNLCPYEFFLFYGPFVMTNFVAGGRATALFAGITNTTEKEEAREKTMDSAMSASFSFKKAEDGSSASLGFGRGFTNGSSSTETFTQLEATIVTSGGAYGFAAFTTPGSVDNMNIDLTDWANSLNDSDTHTLVDIENNGLRPISDFFLEANLKAQCENYIAKKDLPSKNFTEPKLIYTCTPVYIGGAPIFLHYMSLITRFNDVIAIREDILSVFEHVQGGAKKEEAIFDKLCNTYKIKAEIENPPAIDTSTINGDLQNSILYTSQNSNSQIRISADSVSNYQYKSGVCLEAKMKKYLDTDNKILYLLYNENGKKVGYSIYMGKGDFLLDTYGIRQWVRSLPITSVTDNELLNYTLIAL